MRPTKTSSEPSQPNEPVPFLRPSTPRNSAPRTQSASFAKQLLTFKAAEGTIDEFPSEHKKEPKRWAWLVVGVVALAAAGGAAFAIVPRWHVSAATPPTGQVAVVSQPAGASVSVDGQFRGATPLSLALPPGRHALRLNRGDVTRDITVTVKSGAEATHYVDLEAPPEPQLGQLIISSDPPGARVIVDDKARGVTPVSIADVPAGPHAVVIQGESGPVRRSVTVERGQTSSLVVSMAPQAAFGWVSVSSPLVMQVLEEDRKLGTSETDRIVMPAGQHTLRIVNPRLAFQTARVVHVPAGGGAAVKIELPNGTVNLNALPWAEAWIDGRQVGETPLGNFKLPIGDHEAVFRHPQLGERRQAFVVTASDTARVAVDFRK